MISNLPSQTAVKSYWLNENVKVTCVVMCYNHKDYIFECIKGIMTQKTDFAFKVLIYDDFSNDGTREILKALEESYPDIVDVYYADFNHYGVALKDEHISKLEGDYVALCEGDDYWLDSFKLKKQYEEMQNSQVHFCVHPAIIFFQENNYEDLFCYYGNAKKILPQKLIFGLKNQFSPTASYFLRVEMYLEYIRFKGNLDGGPGDFFLEAIASESGVLYLPDVMSAYRRGGQGSYSSSQATSSDSEIKDELSRWSKNLECLSSFYPHLQGLVSEKKILVEVDCLVRLRKRDDVVGSNDNEYIIKASKLLKELGPLLF
ncbi:glycosyltransferase family 2 protein [Vreelandella olivaria]|uniref:glycosyltransferase family 2 protein n=1 Tax=Vreelandella olivaria TaxID=390919 RepID=UPI00201F7AF9|nr:glycosyltransferase family 2 protein [Halomonas olivaria]